MARRKEAEVRRDELWQLAGDSSKDRPAWVKR